jgi:DnaJ family protein C protein 28
MIRGRKPIYLHGEHILTMTKSPRPDQPPRAEDQDRHEREAEVYHTVADRLIEEAMARGEFDDLPGKGKPLDLRETEAERRGEWAAQRIMENSGFKPAWASDRRELLEKADEIRATLARAWKAHAVSLAGGESYAAAALRWDHAVARFREAVEKLNKEIRLYNLKAPHVRLHLRVVDADRVIKQITGG